MIDAATRADLDALRSADREAQGAAFTRIMEATREPVDWAYEAWDELLAMLSDVGNRDRAIAAQVLCNLAKSDPDARMVGDLHALLAVTRDARFVTARHCLQALWKVGVAGEKQREKLLAGLDRRFDECLAEKNCTLIRYDIVEAVRKVYGAIGDESVKAMALELIQREDDLKYRKKYLSLWR